MCLSVNLKKKKKRRGRKNKKRQHLVFVWINYLWFHNNKEGKQSESVQIKTKQPT